MEQLPLEITPAPLPQLDNYAGVVNREALDRIRALVTVDLNAPPHERLVYLWGDSGAGKSHLLQAWAAARPGACYQRAQAGLRFGPTEGRCQAVDDVQQLDRDGALSLFHGYNAWREDGGVLLAAGPCPPRALSLPPEMTSRLAWGLVLRVRAPDDDEILATLSHHARSRGIPVAAEALRHLLLHEERSLVTLLALLERLNRASLALRRPITIPFIRHALGRATSPAPAAAHQEPP